jgi:hypothetical protein
VSAAPPRDIEAIRHVLSRATGAGWEAAYRQDVAALVAEVERLRELLINAGWPALAIAELGAKSTIDERAAVVAWLRAEAYLTLYEATPSDVADAIERGEHRREEKP